MWIFMDDIAVLERAWLRLVGITDQIHRPFLVGFDKAPFQAARKTCATAAAQSRVLDLVDDLGARHRYCLLQLFVTASAQVTVDVCTPIVASEILKNHPTFQGMRRRSVPKLLGLISEKLGHGIGPNLFA